MLVTTATCASATLVASYRPSRPTSTTAASTASWLNQAKAVAVSSSKYDGRSAKNSRSSRAAISLTTRAKSSRSIGSALREMRSVTCSRCGLV